MPPPPLTYFAFIFKNYYVSTDLFISKERRKIAMSCNLAFTSIVSHKNNTETPPTTSHLRASIIIFSTFLPRYPENPMQIENCHNIICRFSASVLETAR